MKKGTDLVGVKSVAKMLFMTDVHETEFSPVVVQHPFTSSGIVVLPEKGGGNFMPLDIPRDADSLQRWRNAVASAIDHSDNVFRIYMMVNKPYGLAFLNMLPPTCRKMIFRKCFRAPGLCTKPQTMIRK